MDSDYGLRKRTSAATEKKIVEVNRPPTVWERFPQNSGFKSLATAEAQSDIKGILAGMDESAKDAKDEQETTGETLDRGKGGKLPRGRKRKRKGVYGRRAKPVDSSANFYYAYKRTKNYEDELEFSRFISEQQYLSLRHAYTKNLESALVKSKQQKAVIDILRKKLEDKMNGVSGLNHLNKTASLLQKALHLVEYHEGREAFFKSQNEELMKRLPAHEKVSPNDVAGARDDSEKQEDASLESELPDTFVNTSYGPGSLLEIRANSTVSVKLAWGAVASLPIGSLCPVSSELVELHKPKEEKVEEGNAEKLKEPVPLDTLWRNGPPRGVELYLSPLSDDPHFALHPALPLDPRQMEEYYKKNADMTRFAFRGEINGQSPIHKINNHGDWDEITLARTESLRDMPCSWTEPNSSPWAEKGQGLSRTELEVWEAERVKHLEDQAKLRRMKHELQRLKGVMKIRDKRILAARENQKYLINRLTSVRKKYADLSLRHVRLLQDQTLKPSANGKSNGSQSNGTLLNGISADHSDQNDDAQEGENEDTKNESDGSKKSTSRKRARSVDVLSKDTDSYGRRISTRRQKKKA